MSRTSSGSGTNHGVLAGLGALLPIWIGILTSSVTLYPRHFSSLMQKQKMNKFEGESNHLWSCLPPVFHAKQNRAGLEQIF